MPCFFLKGLKSKACLVMFPMLLLLVSFAGIAQGSVPLKLFVSPKGSDANDGSQTRPFATLERARNAIRTLKDTDHFPVGGVIVHLRGGNYYLDNTFTLSEKDSGTKDSPIIYRSFNGEDVHLVGGKKVSGFTTVKNTALLARLDPRAVGKILQVDLRANAVTSFGEYKPRGFNREILPAPLDFYYQNKPMTVARWPNIGWSRIAGTPAGKNGGKFSYEGDRPKRWTNVEDIWLHGYWFWDWADSYEKIKYIDIKAAEIITREPHGTFGYKSGQRFYAFNILEELDEPGEWYLDRKNGILYFWPPAPLAPNGAVVSLIDTIIKMENASNVTFRGLVIECCRGTAVTIRGGSNSLVAGCTLRNVGNSAITLDGASNGVSGCDIYQCGESAINLGGGRRSTLTPGGNYADNNKIHDFGQWIRTYQPGVALSGVGNRVSHNVIYNAPHFAILVHGNDHLIEYNDIHHVCAETSDSGAIYMGRDFSERGTIIRYNYLHDLPSGDVQAIYLDDFASGTTIFGNLFYKVSKGVLLGGGRDNTINNNIFVECTTALWVDARGTFPGANNYFNGKNTTLIDRLRAVNYRSPPYSIRYPELLTLYDSNPALPEGNSIINNTSFRCNWLDLKYGATESMLKMSGNLNNTDPGFIDLEHNKFALKRNSVLYRKGLKNIPFEKIGLYNEKYNDLRP